MEKNKIYLGNSLNVLKTFPDESVDLCVTSPPYYNLRNYGGDLEIWGGDTDCEHEWGKEQPFKGKKPSHGKGSNSMEVHSVAKESDKLNWNSGSFCQKCGAWRGELGLEPSPDLYVKHLTDIFREVKRVLKSTGTLWVNIGDSYAGSGGINGVPDDWESISMGNRDKYPKESLTKNPKNIGLKNKDLIGIPWKLAESLKSPYYKGKIKRESDRTWLASIIDGEGSICGSIHDRKDGGGRRSDIFITVTNSNKKILNKCNQIWPTSKLENMEFTLHHKSHWGEKDIYRWIPYSMDNKMNLLQEIYPYMIGKRKQVLLAWNFFKLSKSSKKIWKKYPEKADDYRKKREKIINLLSELNTGMEDNVIIPSWIEEPPSLYEDGWYLRQDIIWAKAFSGDMRVGGAMPESVTDRCSKAHEHIFMLSKKPNYYYNQEAIKEPIAESSKVRYNYPRFGENNKGNSGEYAIKNAEYSEREKESDKGNRRDVWFVKTKPFGEAHFATFPENLIKPIIKVGVPENGIVLDPFFGAGTTGVVAKKEGVWYIGIEKYQKYIDIAEKRIRDTMKKLF